MWVFVAVKSGTAVIIYNDERAKLAKRINIQPKESRALHMTLHATVFIEEFGGLSYPFLLFGVIFSHIVILK